MSSGSSRPNQDLLTQRLSARLNSQLQPIGITARVKLQDNRIQVLVEAAQISEAAAVMPVIQRELEALNAAFLKTAQVYGRNTGEKIPAWTETISLTSPVERLKEQAKQGNPQALAALVNRAIAPQQATAQVQVAGDTVQILIEADALLNQEIITTLVQRQVSGLGGGPLRQVNLYGKRTQEDFPDWQTSLAIDSPPPTEPVTPEPPATPQATSPDSDTTPQTPSGSSGQSFAEQDLRDRSFVGMNLTNANFRAATLTGATFTGVNLTNASLEEAEVSSANFDRACLNGANLQQLRVARAGTASEARKQLLKPSTLAWYTAILGVAILISKGFVLLAIVLAAGLTAGIAPIARSNKNNALVAIRIIIIIAGLVFFWYVGLSPFRLGIRLSMREALQVAFQPFGLCIVFGAILFLLYSKIVAAINQQAAGRLGGWIGVLVGWMISSFFVGTLGFVMAGLGAINYGSEFFLMIGWTFLIVTLTNAGAGALVGRAIAELIGTTQRLSFRYAKLRNANLHGANLAAADLTQADLRGAVLTDTILHGAILPDGQSFYPGIDLTRFTGRRR